MKNSVGMGEEVNEGVGGVVGGGVAGKTEGNREETRSRLHSFARDGGIVDHSSAEMNGFLSFARNGPTRAVQRKLLA